MPHVTHAANGWQAGDDARVYATLREALDVALAHVASKPKAPFLRDPDSGEKNGEWRWLPATEEELAAIDGVRIDAIAIDEMAASLNERMTPIPIDGGPAPSGMLASEVHGTASTHGGTPANGWAHWGVSVSGSDGVAELYLWAELVPSVAREIDAGRIAMGSVHFGCARIEGEDSPRGCVLISHALTNNPAVTTLAPANSVRTDGLTSAWRSRTIAGRVLRSPQTSGGASMGTKQIKRADEEPKVEDEEEPKLEEERAERGPGEDALLAALAAHGAEVPEGASPDDLMGLVAAMLGEPKKDEPKPEGEGEVAAARASAEAALTAVRSEIVTLRAKVAELEPLRAEKVIRDREAAVDGAMAARGMKSGEQRKAFLSVAEKFGNEAALASIDAAHVPPTGTIVKSVTQRGATAPEGETESRSLSDAERESAKSMLVELRSKYPNEPEHVLVARAQRAARQR